jgi:regulator of protease activity HflC (stomatin/prohibitin superfamily)
MEAISEKPAQKINGFKMLFLTVMAFILGVAVIIIASETQKYFLMGSTIILLIIDCALFGGFMILQPNNSAVLILFGKYIGTVKEDGFWWVNPFTYKKKVSTRIHNFISDKIKVNDLHGNPIDIAAVIVWRVCDSARATFDVQNYEQFIAIQSETSIRGIATQYAYDSSEHDKMSLVGNQHEVAEELKKYTQSRLDIAGIEILETRISYLAYAPEIAQAMLRRQQAQAVVAARTKIVEGAVGMVEMALRALSEQHIVILDEDKKATMVNNLMVALVSEAQAQPVINAGSLY